MEYMEKPCPAKTSLSGVSERLHHTANQHNPRSPKQMLSTLCSVNTGKKISGKRRKPLCLIFIKAHHKQRHVTSRQTFIASEAIPFGPQTHHALRRGFSDRQRLPHPSDIPNPKDTDLCHNKLQLQFWILPCTKNLPVPCYLLPTPPQQCLTPNPAPPLPFWVPGPSILSEPCFGYSSFSAQSQCG